MPVQRNLSLIKTPLFLLSLLVVCVVFYVSVIGVFNDSYLRVGMLLVSGLIVLLAVLLISRACYPRKGKVYMVPVGLGLAAAATVALVLVDRMRGKNVTQHS